MHNDVSQPYWRGHSWPFPNTGLGIPQDPPIRAGQCGPGKGEVCCPRDPPPDKRMRMRILDFVYIYTCPIVPQTSLESTAPYMMSIQPLKVAWGRRQHLE